MSGAIKREHPLDAISTDGKNCFQCVCCDTLCYCDDNSGDVYCLKKGKGMKGIIAMQVHFCAESESEQLNAPA
jgi:hypothetical protein